MNVSCSGGNRYETTTMALLKSQIQTGKARLEYAPNTGRIKVVYEDDPLEDPTITHIMEEVRRSLNCIYESHLRIEEIRRSAGGLFYDSKRTEDLSKELNDLIRSQKKVEETFALLDRWREIDTTIRLRENFSIPD